MEENEELTSRKKNAFLPFLLTRVIFFSIKGHSSALSTLLHSVHLYMRNTNGVQCLRGGDQWLILVINHMLVSSIPGSMSKIVRKYKTPVRI